MLARLRAVGADPKNPKLVKFSWKAAGELVQHCDRPGALNQALMELGATVCTVQVRLIRVSNAVNGSTYDDVLVESAVWAMPREIVVSGLRGSGESQTQRHPRQQVHSIGCRSLQHLR